MDKFITVFSIILIFIALLAILFGPGFIARLIFRKTDEIKLMNRVALIPTLIWFSRDDITGMVESFSEGMGYEDLNITKWLILLQFLIIYIVHRFLTDMGIGLADKLLKRKKSQPIK